MKSISWQHCGKHLRRLCHMRCVVMTLQIHSNYLCLPLQKEFLVGSYNEDKDSWDGIKFVQWDDNANSPDDLSVQCCSFSPCGNYIAICLSKDLIIYSTRKLSILCSIKTERKGVSVSFFPKSSVILLAEKSGSVKFFKFLNDKLEKTDLILGHNSMLIEALVTDDERFIVTCDRDEKIRVTNYPNIYNIQCYCLGHTMFVCSINLLQSDKNVLVSSSGDGTIRLWEITTGKELLKYERETQGKRNGEENPSFFSKVTSLKLENDQSLIAALENKSHSITILKVTGNVNNSMNISVYHIIQHSSDPWDIEFWQGNLLSLVSDKNNPIKLYNSKNNSLETPKSIKTLSENLIQNWDLLLKAYNKKLEGFPLLFQYKKDFEDCESQETKKIKSS